MSAITKKNFWPLMCLLGVTPYLISLNTGFFFDDISEIVLLPYIRDFSSFLEGINLSNNTQIAVRPFLYFSFLLHKVLNLSNPISFRIVNLTIHTINIYCVYMIGKLHFSKKHSTLAALMFSLSPIAIESVVQITRRSNSMGTMLCLISFLIYLRINSSIDIKKVSLSAILYLTALLTKEFSISLIPILISYEILIKKNDSIKNLTIKMMPFLIISLIYLLYRFLYLGNIAAMVGGVDWSPSENYTLQYILTQPYSIFIYLKGFFAPINIFTFYPITPIKSILDIRFYTSVILLILICLIPATLKFRKSEQVKLSLFFLFWFFFSLAPTSSFIPLFELAALRRAYIALPALCFLSLILLNDFIRSKKVFTAISMGFVCILFVFNINEQLKYRRPITFWNDIIDHFPDYKTKALAYNNKGIIKLRENDDSAAILSFKKALSCDSNYYSSLFNLGNLMAKRKEYKQAISYYSQSIKSKPSLYQAYTMLGHVYIQMGEYQKAKTHLLKSKEINPNYNKTHRYLNLLP